MSQRLRQARKRAGLSQAKLSRRLDLSSKTISRYETGETAPDEYMLEEIAGTLNVRLGWLKTGEGEMQGSSDKNQAAVQAGKSSTGDIQDEAVDENGERRLPILDLNATAGNGGYVIDESPIGYMTPDQQSPFYEVRQGSRSVYYIPVRGNSMYPTLKRGELVPVRRFEPSASTIKEDDIYVFRWDSHTYIKRLQKLAKHRLKVISDNDAYDAQYIELDEGVDFEVLGQVLV